MIADIKAAVLTGAALTGIGLLSIVGPPTASAQPPFPATFTCPGDGGVHYLADPDDSNAFYTCKDGVQTQHDECPSATILMLDKRPSCEARDDDQGRL